MCEDDQELAENKNLDTNKIKAILIVSYLLKTFKLAMIILAVSYVIGMLWLILCEAHQDFSSSHPDPSFLEAYDMSSRTIKEQVIIAMYFTFTTLSTVGFGDFHPKNSFERIVMTFVLLFGVAIFLYILGEFLDIMKQFMEFDSVYEDGDQLNKFFGTLQNINGNYPLDSKLIRSIEDHFILKWSEDKNFSIKSESDKIFNELPTEV